MTNDKDYKEVREDPSKKAEMNFWERDLEHWNISWMDWKEYRK